MGALKQQGSAPSTARRLGIAIGILAVSAGAALGAGALPPAFPAQAVQVSSAHGPALPFMAMGGSWR